MRILIAGCGYVGSALAVRRVASGDEVFGLRRRPEGLPEGVVPVAADLADPAGLRAAVPEALDAVVYAAAADGRDEAAYRRAYPDGLGHLLSVLPEGAAAPRVLFTSSTSVHGQDDGSFVDESSATAPASFRGRLMLEAEARLQGWPAPAASLRLGGIYGPGRTRLLERVRTGEARAPAAPHYTNRIHRDDAAGALDHLLDRPAVDPLYLGVDDEPAEQGEVLRWLARELGVPEPARDPGGEKEAPATGKRCQNDRLRATGFEFEHPSYRSGYAAQLAALR